MKRALAAAPRLHHDETPVPVNGVTGYVYTARTDNLIWYGAHQTRSHAAVDGFDILPRFAGVLIRDDWHGYHKYSDPTRGGKVTQVQLCCARLLRDLKAVWESDPEHQAWAEQMRQTLKKARRTVDTAITQGAAGLSTTTSRSLRDLYLNTAQQGIDANTPGTAGRSHDAYKLAKRMRERVDQVLNFTLDFHVEWTNNPAEQAIRMAKLQAKISGVVRVWCGCGLRARRLRWPVRPSRAGSCRAPIRGGGWSRDRRRIPRPDEAGRSASGAKRAAGAPADSPTELRRLPGRRWAAAAR
ncbi:IS66 family transposase [Streptomyces vastus]|uniref:Transposase IS66 central domain-containing protein n=1 Tax=Streptomyces vastus TaxID=285451 RepID=A0ABP6D7B5_9ACTN